MTDTPQHETALDGDQQQVGALYAKALLGSAGDSVDGIVAELEAVVSECLSRHPQFEQALASPRISLEQKENMLDRIFNGRIDGKLLSFLKILCRRGRIDSLRAIQVCATVMREEQLGKQRVTLTSAQALSDEQRDQIKRRLQAAYSIDAILIEKIDASLLGGIVLRIGDKVLDGSVLGKLQSLRSAVTSGVQKAIRDRYESLISS
ncbi:MAG: ATP synthase F1 subunit delta [Planctomycetales bacterium]|nr:ATP synthase F1 subunit delta [Planctomycetales bacterium]MCA9181007.1 ATP synthase F1 subunit delta [Planctomycetales bacterium]